MCLTLLLPIATSLSKNVFLWGFDGRAPNATNFWVTSNNHSYPELMDGLRDAHPAFFNYYLPKGREGEYVTEVHGDLLDMNLKN